MKNKFIEIEDFSPKELTDMFDYICTTVLKTSPIEVKQTLLGMKAPNKNSKVTLSQLLVLIEKHELNFKFKVMYIEPEKEVMSNFEKAIDETATNAIAENANGGVKTDVLHDAMNDQSKALGQPTRVFTEVLGSGNSESEDKAPAGNAAATFDPNAIPEFKP